MTGRLLRPNTLAISVFVLALLAVSPRVLASEEGGEAKLNVSEVILEHVMDDHQWHLSDGLVIPLPIIVYSGERGLEVFSSSNFLSTTNR